MSAKLPTSGSELHPSSAPQMPESPDIHTAVSRLLTRVEALDRERLELLAMIREITGQIPSMQHIGKTPSVLVRSTKSSQRSDLPMEILRQIFICCLPDEGEAVMDPNEPPLLFGRVSTQWRDLAWSTTELWDSIQLLIPALHCMPFEYESMKWDAYIVAIDKWLSRSKNRPLHIRVTDADNLPWKDQREALVAEVVRCLAAESCRWRSFRWCLPGYFTSEIHVAAEDVPLIETLEIELPQLNVDLLPGDGQDPEALADSYDDFSDINEELLSIIISCPLQSLHIDNISLLGGVRKALNSCKWQDLVRLDLGHETVSRCHCLTPFNASLILAHLAKLGSPLKYCHLALAVENGSPQMRAVVPEIILTSLQDFAITFVDPGLLDRFNEHDKGLIPLFNALITPSLNSLKYKTSYSLSNLPFLSLMKKTSTLRKVAPLTNGTRLGLELQASCRLIEELHLPRDFSQVGIYRICDFEFAKYFPRLHTLILDCSPPQSEAQIYENLYPERGPLVHTSARGAAFRHVVERARYEALEDRIELIKGWVKQSGKGVPQKVAFRLNERLREHALRRLAPLIADGLRIFFKEDNYDVPPP